MNGFAVTWQGTGRKAQHPPNPDYPNGMQMDIATGSVGCVATLPYPAPEVGRWHIECLVCQFTVLVTAAGRPDDPVSIRVPCKAIGTA